MERLKLIAMDSDDLAVISAHCQDAVMKAGDLQFLPAEKRFLLAMNRFAWEKAVTIQDSFERRKAMLHFERVENVKHQGFDLKNREMVLSLLAITFSPGSSPAGTIELAFAGGATVRLGVECIEAKLSDMAAAWQAGSMPDHAVNEQGGISE
jgi:hypothetical protein